MLKRLLLRKRSRIEKVYKSACHVLRRPVMSRRAFQKEKMMDAVVKRSSELFANGYY
jgi:hypothetical protein